MKALFKFRVQVVDLLFFGLQNFQFALPPGFDLRKRLFRFFFFGIQGFDFSLVGFEIFFEHLDFMLRSLNFFKKAFFVLFQLVGFGFGHGHVLINLCNLLIQLTDLQADFLQLLFALYLLPFVFFQQGFFDGYLVVAFFFYFADFLQLGL